MRNFLQSILAELSRANGPAAADDRARQGRRARASMDGCTACHLRQPGRSRSRRGKYKNAGFTLVEMIAVIVLLSFGLIAGTQLFTMTAKSYRDTSARMKQTQDGRFIVERLSRELREALPGSVRQSSISSPAKQCVEWLPIQAASRYLSIPALSATSFTVMEIDPDLVVGITYYAVIFPIDSGTGTLYGTSGGVGTALNQLKNPPMALGAADTSPTTDLIYLQNAVTAASFPTASPADRVFFVTSPVAVCVLNDGRMLRYSNYGFVAQATALVDSAGVLLAENLLLDDSGAVSVFTVSGATLTRNSMVQLDMRIRDPNTKDVLRLQHTVFVRNVP